MISIHDGVNENNIDWHPMERSANNFCTHKIKIDSPTVIRVRPTGSAIGISLSILVTGLYYSFMILQDLGEFFYDTGTLTQLSNQPAMLDTLILLWHQALTPHALFVLCSEVLPLLCTIGVSLLGCYLLYRYLAPIKFDKDKRIVMLGYRADKKNSNINPRRIQLPFDRISALQIVSKHSSSRQGKGFTNYELNLVLNDSSRVNITSHGDKEEIYKSARTIASLVDIPIWATPATSEPIEIKTLIEKTQDPLAKTVEWQCLDKVPLSTHHYTAKFEDSNLVSISSQIRSASIRILLKILKILVGLSILLLCATSVIVGATTLRGILGLTIPLILVTTLVYFVLFIISNPRKHAIIIDKKTQCFYAGKNLSKMLSIIRRMKKGSASISSSSKEHGISIQPIHTIHAIQLLTGPSQFGLNIFELNLVLDDGRRINALTVLDREQLFRHSKIIAKFIKKPIWNAVH